MRTHITDANLQASAASVLRDLASSSALRNAIVVGGGLSCIVAAMSAHAGSSEVQRACCGALCNISPAAGVIAAVVFGPALPCVYSAMKTHGRVAGVVESATMWALWSLTLTAEGRDKLGTTRARAAVEAAARLHPNSAPVAASAAKILDVLSQ